MLNVDRSMIPSNFRYMPTDTDYVYNPKLTCTCHYNPDIALQNRSRKNDSDQ